MFLLHVLLSFVHYASSLTLFDRTSAKNECGKVLKSFQKVINVFRANLDDVSIRSGNVLEP